MYKNLRVRHAFIVDRISHQKVVDSIQKEFSDISTKVEEFDHSYGWPMVGESGDYVQVSVMYNPTMEFYSDLSWKFNKESFMDQLQKPGVSIMDAIQNIAASHTNPFDNGSAESKLKKIRDEHVSGFEALFQKLRKDLGFPLRRRENWPDNGLWLSVRYQPLVG